MCYTVVVVDRERLTHPLWYPLVESFPLLQSIESPESARAAWIDLWWTVDADAPCVSKHMKEGA